MSDVLAPPSATSSRTADPHFRSDVLKGLAEPQKAIPARWFYDDTGSRLFEDITRLAEYYPTRVESALLAARADDIASAVGPGRAVVELGSGSSAKTPLLLRAVAPSAYVPIDISGDFLRESAAALASGFPGLPVYPLEADFTHPYHLPREVADLPKLGFFPGSTIGNMIPKSACDLLRQTRTALGTGAMMLIGMDRIKDQDVLLAAYDDAKGITAAFNRNLLERINRELGGTIPVESFRHRAVWNEVRARIEMHLEATENVRFLVDGTGFTMAKGETIHTENSHKYGLRDARMLLRTGGWTPIEHWSDEQENFSLFLAEAQPHRSAP